MQKLKGFRRAKRVRPKATAVPRYARLIEGGRRIPSASEDGQRAALARIKNEIETFDVFAAGDHRHKQFFGTRNGRKPLKLPYFAPPNLFEVVLAGAVHTRPDLDEHLSSHGIARRHQPGSARRLIRPDEISLIYFVLSKE
jgi:hypothetical protein